MDHVFSSFGRGRGALRPSEDWDVRVGGNDQAGLGSTPGERSPRKVPPPGSVRFAPGVFSTPMPQGEGAPDNFTRYEGGDMSLTRGAEGSLEAPGFQQFYSLLQERQTILEGVVDRIQGEMGQFRGEIGQFRGEMGQIQGELGAVSGRVDNLGQDMGALRGDIGSLKSDMTSQLESMETNMGSLKSDMTSHMGSMETNMGTQLSEITQMLAGMMKPDKPLSVTERQELKVTASPSIMTSSQGSPWVPSSLPMQCPPVQQPVHNLSSTESAPKHNPGVTSVFASQGRPVSTVDYSSLGSSLPSTIAFGSLLSGNAMNGGYPVHPSMGPSAPGHVAGGMGVSVTAPTASSATNLGSQGSGYYGGLVGQSAALGGAPSFVPGIGGWSGVPQGHT